MLGREGGASSTPRLLDLITSFTGILGRPVKPGDDVVGGAGALPDYDGGGRVAVGARGVANLHQWRTDCPEFVWALAAFASPQASNRAGP